MKKSAILIILILILVISGCIEQIGYELKPIEKETESSFNPLKPSTPEEVCKDNVLEQMKIDAEKSTFKLKNPTVLVVNQFNDIPSATEFASEYNVFLFSWSSIEYDPFLVAIARWDLVTPDEFGGREFKAYFCDLNGSVIKQPIKKKI